jgi:2-methylisocitrate lyase-like PEP mutase family enzyme
MSADVTPDVRELREVGVKRVAFAAGELDGTYAPLQRVAERLAREGIETRFTSLGRVGHVYIPETTAHATALHDAIVWAGEG